MDHQSNLFNARFPLLLDGPKFLPDGSNSVAAAVTEREFLGFFLLGACYNYDLFHPICFPFFSLSFGYKSFFFSFGLWWLMELHLFLYKVTTKGVTSPMCHLWKSYLPKICVPPFDSRSTQIIHNPRGGGKQLPFSDIKIMSPKPPPARYGRSVNSVRCWW